MNPCHACGNPWTRLYGTGHCCPEHTPAAVAGRAEAYVDPTLTADALFERGGIKHQFMRNDSSLIDERAVLHGKRRANLHTWRDAQREENRRKSGGR